MLPNTRKFTHAPQVIKLSMDHGIKTDWPAGGKRNLYHVPQSGVSAANNHIIVHKVALGAALCSVHWPRFANPPLAAFAPAMPAAGGSVPTHACWPLGHAPHA